MFNNEFKEAYLNQSGISSKTYKHLIVYYFEKSAKYEELNGKDLSNFTVTEIKEMYKSFLSKSLETLNNINCQYIKYTRYMLSQNMVKDSQNHFEEIDNEFLNKCVVILGEKENIISREKLLRDIKDLENPCDAFLCLGFFEGISGKNYSDYYNLSMDDFDGNVVHLPNNRSLEISDELRTLARQSSEEYVYKKYGENFKGMNSRQFVPDDKRIIKAKNDKREAAETATLQRQRIYSALVRVKNYFRDNAYSAKFLQESGRINMIKGIMKETGINDPREILSDKKYKDIIIHRYGRITNESVNAYMIKYGKYFNEG